MAFFNLNIRSCFKKFCFMKYKKSFFRENTRNFLILGLESSISLNTYKYTKFKTSSCYCVMIPTTENDVSSKETIILKIYGNR